jgi:hypothetical protein
MISSMLKKTGRDEKLETGQVQQEWYLVGGMTVMKEAPLKRLELTLKRTCH